MEYYERKEKQVELQKKIQSSNVDQARLKVLKHRDDHRCICPDEAKVQLGGVTKDKKKYRRSCSSC